MSLARIVILEDDTTMAAEVELFLVNQGYVCSVVHDGALLFKEDLTQVDLYLLDINVPTYNGMQVCKKIREYDKASPILMLTAYGAVSDKVKALEFGADDYLVKPFHFEELLARIKALLRRSKATDENDITYKIEDLLINATQMSVSRGDKKISLTPKEYKLLELLAASNGRIVSKQLIASKVWDANFETGTNTIEVYINFLRSKVDKGFDHKLIHTKPGFGYYLKRLD
jgi:DNA-binding response OmpR family regulator